MVAMKSLMILLLAGGVLAGCTGGMMGFGEAPPPTTPAGTVMQALTPGSRLPTEGRVLAVRLRMISVEVPYGVASGSEDLWRYVDEEPVAAMEGLLGRNGLRVGHGKSQAWPDITRALTKMTGQKMQEASMLVLPGDVVPIILKQYQPEQTIFLSYRDRTLSGQDYPAGDCILCFVCTLDQDDPRQVCMTVMPQIRSTERREQITEENGQFMMQLKPTVFSMPSLTFRLNVPSRDFLVVGPGAQSRRPTSLAHGFLVKQRDGMSFETVLVIMPEVFWAPVKSGEATSRAAK
jgi:hypothetical protein